MILFKTNKVTREGHMILILFSSDNELDFSENFWLERRLVFRKR
jgi:hypothetical protein